MKIKKIYRSEASSAADYDAIVSRMTSELTPILREFSGSDNPEVSVKIADDRWYFGDYSEYSTKGEIVRTALPGTPVIMASVPLEGPFAKYSHKISPTKVIYSYLEKVGQALSQIKGVRASGEAVVYQNGKPWLSVDLILPKIKAADPDAIPKDITLSEFARKYVGAKGKNKTTQTPIDISGCCTLEDGTECVAYFSHGSAASKKKLVTPLKNFARNFVAPPEGKMPSGAPMDISDFDGIKYTTKSTPHPAYVVGSFINTAGDDCLVLDSPDSIQRYSWATLDDFNKRYTRVSESRGPRIKKVFRSEAASKVAVTEQNLDDFYNDLHAALKNAGYEPFDSFDEFRDDLEGIGQVVLFNVADDDEYSAWCDSHDGDDAGYADHYIEVADSAAKKIKAALSDKYTGFDIDSDKDDIQVFVFLTIDAIGD